MVQGPAIKGMEAQVIFPLILPVRWKGLRRSRWILQVSNCLYSWCWQKGFGFYDHKALSEDLQWLGRDKIHVTK